MEKPPVKSGHLGLLILKTFQELLKENGKKFYSSVFVSTIMFVLSRIITKYEI